MTIKPTCPSTAEILRIVRAKGKISDHVRYCGRCRAIAENFVRTETPQKEKQ